MGIFKPQVRSEAVESQATPFAGNILELLTQQLKEGTLGEGIGAPQQEAGDAIRQFINARMDPERFAELTDPIRQASETRTDRNAAQTREAFGSQGNRLSTSLARTEGRQRAESGVELDSLISQMFLADQGNLLAAIGQQQNFGAQNLAPAFDLAGQGINPEEKIIEDSQVSQVIKPLAEFVKIIMSTQGAPG